MSDRVDLTKMQWNPDDPELSSDMCAYEASAIRRLIWSKWPVDTVSGIFDVSTFAVRSHLAEDQPKLAEAWQRNRPIYAGMYNPGYGVGYDFGEKLG